MACLEMYNQNPDHEGINNPPPISPRISFSNDFLESSSRPQSHMRPTAAYRDAPVSSDFEFSVSNHSMMSADELFFKGRLLPFKEACDGGKAATTLRDELQLNEENDEDLTLRPPKNPTRWKGFLGLKKSHLGSKKSPDKAHVVEKSFGLHEDEQCTKNSQDE